jgi:hypothetical protein
MMPGMMPYDIIEKNPRIDRQEQGTSYIPVDIAAS